MFKAGDEVFVRGRVVSTVRNSHVLVEISSDHAFSVIGVRVHDVQLASALAHGPKQDADAADGTSDKRRRKLKK